MDTSAPADPPLQSLMPKGRGLDLFVTATDFHGYDRELLIADPRVVDDRAHRHVLRFRFRGPEDADDFGREDNGWLAFAARATSSFPGAFGAVRPSEFPADLPDRSRFFRTYELSHAGDASEHSFVDGGVLDNKPFDHAIRAIRERPADSEVDRRLVYLEPSPAARGEQAPGPAPSPLLTALGSVAGIPRQQPIGDQILDVGRANERVRRVRDIVELSFDAVREIVETAIRPATLEDIAAAPGDLGRWKATLHDAAREAVGAAYPTYVRSKISAVVERYAATICRLSDYPEDCNQAAFVRAVLRARARTRLLGGDDGPVRLAPQHEAFLRRFDLDYGVRRLRFVIDALGWWYAPKRGQEAPPRAELDAVKGVLWDARTRLTEAMAGRGLDTDLTPLVLACFKQTDIDAWTDTPESYAKGHEKPLAALEEAFGGALDAALAGFGDHVLEDVVGRIGDWPAPVRRDLLARHLGFPIWDAVLFPVQSMADVGERDAIEIVRFSPDDAKVLDAEEPKLCGSTLGHFGAFFDRDGRERDYLWGRLDAAVRLIDMLLGDAGVAREDREPWYRDAFAAIVAEERDALPHAAALLEQAEDYEPA
jgi:patatin-related protein